MPQRIKFRAWDRKLKLWTVPFTLKDIAGGEFMPVKDLEDMDVVEFTGLKDKNGVEIYEGDVIIGHGFGSDPFLPLPVAWGFSGFTVQKGDTSMHLDPRTNDVQIVGNIYQHTELIKEQ